MCTVFFFKQKTAYELRSSDWSSDVCSSDLHRTAGGLVAGILFVLPGAAVILLLSVLYAGFRELTAVQALFFGIKAAVLAVVIEAVIRIGRRALKNRALYAIAAAAFIAIFFLEAPFPLIVVTAAVVGFIGGRLRPDLFRSEEHPSELQSPMRTSY